MTKPIAQKKQTRLKSLQDLAAWKDRFRSEEDIREEEEKLLALKRSKLEEKQKAEAKQRAVEEQASILRSRTQMAYEEEIKAISELNPEKTKHPSSKAKAAGLKSTFVLDPNSLLMTSFGKGNQAELEKHIVNGTVTTLSSVPAYNAVKTEEYSFDIQGRMGIKATVDNPLYRKGNAPVHHDDQIHLRSALEKAFFDATFEDSLHVQIAYNILDIDKLLAVHINHIIYTLNNLNRTKKDNRSDLFEFLSFAGTKWSDLSEEKKTEYISFLDQPQLGYFGNTLMNHDMLKKCRKNKVPQLELDQLKQEMYQRAYTLLCVLGECRQSNAHGAVNTWTAIYRISPEHDSEMKAKSGGSRKEKPLLRKEARDALKELYTSRVEDVNSHYLQRAGTDLKILFDVLNATSESERQAIARDYYDFIVRKSYKNLGFSVKKLRQLMVEGTFGQETDLTSERFDTVRHKLNHLLDFTVFKRYQCNEAAKSLLISRLRQSTNEAQKEAAYRLEARDTWADIRTEVITRIIPSLDAKHLKELQSAKLPPIEAASLHDIFLTSDVSEFSMVIYLLTRFLDAKEINLLLTQLISKFDNIASLLAVIGDERSGLSCHFRKPFSLFASSSRIVKELRDINSFARMSEETPEARGAMFRDAADLLGCKIPEAEMSAYISGMLSRDPTTPGSAKKDMGFRNFIANNVIESDRFRYLVRYSEPKTIRRMAENEKVISFVLREIPDDQVLRYYNSCEGMRETACAEWMRPKLVTRITRISFGDFEDVHQGNRATPQEKEDKERKKAIIRLYLTVMYLLVKNLVYVNSRYFLAFHCAERDAILCEQDRYVNPVVFDKGRNYILFARDQVDHHPHHPRLKDVPGKPPRVSRVQNYLLRNFSNSDVWAVRTFRNTVEHLNAVRDPFVSNGDIFILSDLRQVDSYFGIYHYLIQRKIADQFDHDADYESRDDPAKKVRDSINPIMKGYFDLVKKHGTYCKDMVKALNVPFAYNFPRYKNLSCEPLFDKNRPCTKEDLESCTRPDL